MVDARCRASGERVAIKTYHKDRTGSLQLRQISREISIHMGLNHPGLVPLYAAFEDDEGIHLVMQLAEQGDLFGELSRQGGFLQEEYVAVRVALPLLKALAYLHERVRVWDLGGEVAIVL